MTNGFDFCDYCTNHMEEAKEDEGIRITLDLHALPKRERANYLSQFGNPDLPHYTSDVALSVHVPFLLRQPDAPANALSTRVRASTNSAAGSFVSLLKDFPIECSPESPSS